MHRLAVLETPQIWQKLERVESDLEGLRQGVSYEVPLLPGRDLRVVLPEELPPKKGLSFAEGQARMLHDLASIELQALELGLRTLAEFPEAPLEFRDQLAQVTASEAVHLRLCLEALEDLGFRWGDWPVHVALWQAVDAKEELLDRILIVHRYLEGSGLDAGDTLLRRLAGVAEGPAHQVVAQIVREEVDHVAFGSLWYRRICEQQKLDPTTDFVLRFQKLIPRIPKRIEKISTELRRRAGFNDAEISCLEAHRASIQKFPAKRELELLK